MQVWARVIELLRASAPGLSLAVLIVTVLEAAVGIAVLYIIKVLADTITAELASPNQANLNNILVVLVVVAVATVAAAVLKSLTSILRMRQSLIVRDHVDKEIHDRAVSVDLRFYESPKYYDALERARTGGSGRPAQAVGNVVSMFRATLTLLAIFALLASLEWLLIPILAIPIGFALFVRLHFTNRLFGWRMSRAQMERRASYLDWLMTKISHAKDLRLNRIGAFLRDQFRGLRREIREGEIKIEQARLVSELAFTLLGAAVFLVTAAWMLQQSLQEARPIGDVVLFVLLLRRAEASGNEFIGNTSMIADDHLYLSRLFDFLSVKPSITTPTDPVPVPNEISSGIKLNDVSFKYDEAESYALRDITLELRPKQIVALVGENGSGKTTLIKLLTRLYDPTDGTVTLDDTDIREFDPETYRKLLSVIFQDYSMYAETVEENIRFGDVALPYDFEQIRGAAKAAGAADFIEKLPQQFGTKLTKMFDNGHDLSIGQWQRLALARAFFPNSQFVILDEPTSAVDPKAEFELFENFRTRLGDRSALIISHRLSTVRQADYTYVLENGRICEHGTHNDLVKRRGRYADLFEKQARNYR